MKVFGEILKWVGRICTLGLSLIGEKAVVREYLSQVTQCRQCKNVDACALVNKGYGCNKFDALEVLK